MNNACKLLQLILKLDEDNVEVWYLTGIAYMNKSSISIYNNNTTTTTNNNNNNNDDNDDNDLEYVLINARESFDRGLELLQHGIIVLQESSSSSSSSSIQMTNNDNDNNNNNNDDNDDYDDRIHQMKEQIELFKCKLHELDTLEGEILPASASSNSNSNTNSNSNSNSNNMEEDEEDVDEEWQ